MVLNLFSFLVRLASILGTKIFYFGLFTLFFVSSRLGRHGKVFLTIPSQSSTDEQKFIQKGEAPGSDSLFDLDPEAMVFFVGGFPPGFRVTAASFTDNIFFVLSVSLFFFVFLIY